MPTALNAEIPYRLQRQSISISGDITLDLTSIANLDEAVDHLCENVPAGAEAEARALDLSPYYGVIWASGRGLAEHLAKMGGFLEGKTVLELGCGLALPSIVAAKLGAKVTALDFHPDVPKFLKVNSAQNGVQIDFKLLDWRTPDLDLGKFDFVMGSDILYESSHPETVARQITTHCHRGSHVLLADPGRTYLQSCVDAITAHGYRSDLFIKPSFDPDGDKRDVFLFSFQRG